MKFDFIPLASIKKVPSNEIKVDERLIEKAKQQDPTTYESIAVLSTPEGYLLLDSYLRVQIAGEVDVKEIWALILEQADLEQEDSNEA